MTTTQTLPPPTRGHYSAAVVSTYDNYASAAVMRLGDGFTIEESPTGFAAMRVTDDGRQIVLTIHKSGIPALIAELQRLTL